MVVAALLNFEDGAGVILLAGDGQRLKGRGLIELAHGADLAVLPHGLFQQRDHLQPALGADDEPCAGVQQPVAHPLGEATAQHDLALRVFPAQAAGQLHGLLVPGAGDGAGVENVHVRRA